MDEDEEGEEVGPIITAGTTATSDGGETKVEVMSGITMEGDGNPNEPPPPAAAGR